MNSKVEQSKYRISIYPEHSVQGFEVGVDEEFKVGVNGKIVGDSREGFMLKNDSKQADSVLITRLFQQLAQLWGHLRPKNYFYGDRVDFVEVFGEDGVDEIDSVLNSMSNNKEIGKFREIKITPYPLTMSVIADDDDEINFNFVPEKLVLVAIEVLKNVRVKSILDS